MKIEIRQRLVGCSHFLYFRDNGEEALQLGGAPQGDSSAASGHHRGVADELNGVADSLLSMEENGLAVQSAAVPERAGERGAGQPFL
jgi:hypothetical protein